MITRTLIFLCAAVLFMRLLVLPRFARMRARLDRLANLLLLTLAGVTALHLLLLFLG